MTIRTAHKGIYLAISAAILSLGGCATEGLEVPISFQSPGYEFNVTEHVEEYEDDVCADADSQNCKVIMALDETDDGQVSNPPRIPAEFPETVTVSEEINGATVSTDINLEDWATDQGLESTVSDNVAFAIEVDLTENADVQADIDAPDLISNVDITSVAIAWLENTLTFTVPSIEIHVGDGLLLEADEDSSDAAQRLLAAGDVNHIGTLQETPPGATDDTDFNLASGGSDTLKEALQSLKFTVVLVVPEGQEIGMEQNDNGLWVKPQGEGEVAMKADITYTVTAGDVQAGLNF